MNITAINLTGKTSDFLKVGVAAAGRGNLEAVIQVLELKPEWLHRIGSHGRTMLWEASYRGRLPVVDFLIQQGANIDSCGCHYTPLLVDISPYCAAKFKNHERTAQFLLGKGARLDLFTHVFLGQAEKVKSLIEKNPDCVREEKTQHDSVHGATALHYAVSSNQIGLLDLLLKAGADPIPYSESLLRFALFRESVHILERLFQAGVEPMGAAIPRSGITNSAINKLLDDHGVPFDPNVKEGGWPPLAYAARGDRGGNLSTIQQLLDQGADVNGTNYKGQTALHCAAKAGFVQVVELLLKRGAVVDATDSVGNTPLMAAISSSIKKTARLIEVGELLIQAGADIYLENNRGISAYSMVQRKQTQSLWNSVIDKSVKRS